MSSGSDKWSTLPGEIVSAIANRLDLNSDQHCMRALCSAWRSNLSHLASVCPPFAFPIEVPPPCNSYASWNQQGSFFLNECIVYRLAPLGGSSDFNKIGSSDGWMIKVSKTYRDSKKYSLLVPLSLEKFKAPMGSLPKMLNRLNYDVTEICRSYDIRFLNHGEASPASCAPITRRTVVLRDYVFGYAFVVLILSYGGTIKFWRIGDSDWTKIETDEDYYFDDVVLFEGKCYAIDKPGRLVLIDSLLRLSQVGTSIGCNPQQNNYLVVGLDLELYMVAKVSSMGPELIYAYGDPDSGLLEERLITFPTWLRVFKLSKKTNDWEHTNNVGDQVFFLGDDATFCAFARDLKGCKGSCVYLTDECFLEDNEGGDYGEDTGVYDMKTMESVALAVERDFATFFWPPPSWLVMDENCS